MQVTLQVTSGPHSGQTFTLQGHDTFLVGRSRRAHLRLPAKDMYFSRVHFLVEMNPPFCRLMDMGSRNGTHVNGQKVDMVDLKDGDQIRAGHTVFQLSLVEGVPEGQGFGPTLDTQSPAAGTSFPSVRTTSDQSQPATSPGPLPGMATTVPPGATPGQTTRGTHPPEASPATYAARTRPAEGLPGPGGPVTGPQDQSPAALPLDCAVCHAPRSSVPTSLLAGTAHPLDGRLCADCLRRMNSHVQTVPGYRLLRELGRGGMGVVSLASRDSDGKFVALKTIIPAVETASGEVQKFLREADILRQLEHPHIVRFLDMNCDGGQLWFAMDYVPGTDAGRLLRKLGPLSVPRAVNLVSQLLKALEYAHARGFIHRDIKPGNLLVTRRSGKETAVLADFGLARVYQASQLSGLTITGAMGGTPMFMPPEQITHYRHAQPPADQYAAAMTLYNLLTGCYGFDMPDQFKQWIALILEEEPVPIRDRRPDIPKGLADVIHRALRKEPQQRFSDARAMRQALRPFLPSA
jgi:eukaryotic-like serine/threonine-protein kinase